VALAGMAGLLAWAVLRTMTSPRVALSNQPDFPNDSRREHGATPMQTWAAFLKETYQQQKNAGATVELGRGVEIGIVGESFHLPELQWIRLQGLGSEPEAYPVRFHAYLIPEPENPYGRDGNAVRVESPRGGTIGHLSDEHALAYASVFKVLHAARRVGVCRARAFGGTASKPNIGVWVTIGDAAWLAEQITEAPQPLEPRRKRTSTDRPPENQSF
jgi:hypothetical protein